MALADAINAPPEELDRMFKEYDQEDPNIEMHFSSAELTKMSEYEKKRLRNIKRNYLVMNAIGFFACFHNYLYKLILVSLCNSFGYQILSN